jgi:hypothetical protein
MRHEDKIDPGHEGKRAALRGLGILLCLIGGILLAVGLIDFFSAFAGFGGPPRLFGCAFVGMILLGIGASLLKFGFMGAAARYEAGEIAPVATDTLNAVAEDADEGIKTVAHAIREGLTGEPEEGEAVRCPACGEENDNDASFCKSCGAALARICPACKARNDADARFCDKCGAELSGER